MTIKLLKRLLVCTALLVSGHVTPADDGLPYRELASPKPTQTGDKIEVLEFFWYGCPHCYAFEPYIKKWLKEKADYIEFVRMPSVLNSQWLVHARAFYVAQELGVLDKTHRALFDAIHRDRRRIVDEKSLANFFAEHDVDKSEFKKKYHSETVEEKIKAAFMAERNFQLTGVPMVVINGKYVTGARQAGSFRAMIDVINDLAEKEHALAQAEQ